MGFLFFAGIGIVILVFRALADRTEVARKLAIRIYREPGYIIFLRALPMNAPIAGLGSLLFGVVFLLPRPLNGWFAVPAIVLIGAAVLLSYRVPQPFMPRWMHEEIDAGRLSAAKPDLMDWLFLAVTGPVFLLSPLALVLWLLVHTGAGG